MRSVDLDQLWPTVARNIAKDVAKATPQLSLPHFGGNAQSRDDSTNDIANFNASSASFSRRNFLRRHVRTFDTSAAVWLAAGFMIGTASWHAPAILAFMAVKQNETPVAEVSANSPARPAAINPIATGSLSYFSPRPDACTALAMDREFSATKALQCNGALAPMRDAGQRRRGDQMTSAEDRRDATITQPAPTVPAVKSKSSSEFDLTIKP